MIDLFAPPSDQEIEIRRANRQKKCVHEWTVEKACCINNMPMMRCIYCKVLEPVTDVVFKKYLSEGNTEYGLFDDDEDD